jgi:hypothetical protein
MMMFANSKIYISLLIGLLPIINNSYCQDTLENKIQFSARYLFYYNYRLTHHSTVFSIELNNHNFYLGPEYSIIFQPTPIADVIYEQNSFGSNFGYRYFFFERRKKIKFFSQLNFSVYQIKYKVYQLGPYYATNRKRIVVENTGTIGLDYCIYKQFHLSGGIGFGSMGGFFLMLNSFIPCSYVGLEYKF